MLGAKSTVCRLPREPLLDQFPLEYPMFRQPQGFFGKPFFALTTARKGENAVAFSKVVVRALELALLSLIRSPWDVEPASLTMTKVAT